MALNDSLANALSKIERYEGMGKKVVEIKPKSKIIKQILTILNEQGYVGKFEDAEDGKGGYLKLNLLGKINGCGVIKPRFPFKVAEIENEEKQYLPGKDFGLIIVSTPEGLMVHNDAQSKKTGGV